MSLLVFDSGIGGLGVVAQLRAMAPEADITYLADNAVFPYGEKPDAFLVPHIVALLSRAVEIFRPQALVVACNTASTIALPALRAALALPIIGCVPPIKPAAAASATKTIGVLATAATVRRPYLNGLIAQFAPDCAVLALGTPALAELAEQKFCGAMVDVGPAVAPLFTQPGGGLIDAIALGCTHYTFLRDELEALYPCIAWFDPAAPVARQTLRVTGPLFTMAAPQTAYFTAAPLAPSLLAPFGFTAAKTWQP